MANNEEKVSKFVQAITAYAEEQRDKTLREIESFKEERMQKAEQDVLSDAYQMIQKETLQIRADSVREMSRRDLDARKKVLSRRQAIMDEVFARAVEKLRAYAATPAYTDYLLKLLADMAAVLPAEGTVYAVSEADKGCAEALASRCPAGSRVETAADIRIGGLRGVNSHSGQIIDNTLDSRLESQRDWFTATSGLTIN